jgi:hypothetical protein
MRPSGQDPIVADDPSDEPVPEPGAQVLPERKLLSLVSADPLPDDLPVPEPDADDPGADQPDLR